MNDNVYITAMILVELRPEFELTEDTALILGLRPANEKHRYKVTPSLIGWAQT